jgi:glutathione peroxidase
MRFLYFPRKVDVNGEDAARIYKFLKSSKTGPFGENKVELHQVLG